MVSPTPSLRAARTGPRHGGLRLTGNLARNHRYPRDGPKAFTRSPAIVRNFLKYSSLKPARRRPSRAWRSLLAPRRAQRPLSRAWFGGWVMALHHVEDRCGLRRSQRTQGDAERATQGARRLRILHPQHAQARQGYPRRRLGLLGGERPNSGAPAHQGLPRRSSTGAAGPAVLVSFEAKLTPTRWQPHRPFRGWRYLEPKEVPKDLPKGAKAKGLPPKMEAELRELGLI